MHLLHSWTLTTTLQTGAKLAAALLCNFVGRWNIDRGVANRNQRSYGIYDHRLVPIFDAVQNDNDIDIDIIQVSLVSACI